MGTTRHRPGRARFDTTPSDADRQWARSMLTGEDQWAVARGMLGELRRARALGCLGALVAAMTEAETPERAAGIAQARAVYEVLDELEEQPAAQPGAGWPR